MFLKNEREWRSSATRTSFSVRRSLATLANEVVDTEGAAVPVHQRSFELVTFRFVQEIARRKAATREWIDAASYATTNTRYAFCRVGPYIGRS